MKLSGSQPCVWSLLCLALAQPAFAEQGFEASIALGYGQFGAITHNNEATPLIVLPRWSYYGERFYVENLDVGFNLWQHQGWSIDLTTKQSFDALLMRQHSLTDSLIQGLLSSNVPLPLPMGAELPDYLHPSKRHLSYLAGATVFYQQDHFQMSSAYHQDISEVHQGFEWQSNLSYVWHFSKLAVATSAEFRLLSADYANYHFGVGRKDTTGQLYEYLPDSAWLTSIKVEANYPLTTNVSFVANFRREWLPSQFEPSMYFKQRQHDIWFSGVMWTW